MIQKSQLSNYEKVKELGKKSEDFFEIVLQPKNTCPLIDDAIHSIEHLSCEKGEIDDYLSDAMSELKSAIKTLERSDVSENEDVRNALNELESIMSTLKQAERVEITVDSNDVSSVVDELEAIRTNCEKIRDWGQAWKVLFLDVFNSPFSLFRWCFRLWIKRTVKLKNSLVLSKFLI